ncbi:MAG: hypothetical protein OHK0029_28640 [Armatimonadaceae bacterium]
MHIELFPQASALLCFAALAAPQVPLIENPVFSPVERRLILSYWNQPGRYSVVAAADKTAPGPWEVRPTAEGSRWFYAYQKATGVSMNPALRSTPALNGPFGEWEAWVRAKIAYDRWQAQQRVALANGVKKLPPGIRLAGNSSADGMPPPPGPMPGRLREVCGDAPLFAEAAQPRAYTVVFDKAEETFTYTDHVRLYDRYAYYRFPEGVVSYGTRLAEMPEAERDTLFRLAGFSPSEERILSAVSRLEGGFETVQTYDTGYVSIGFIQFVSLEEGRADLAAVLARMKAETPREFQADFRRFGIDVSPDGVLTVVDPATGAELLGKNAVRRIIEDKRLTAVFQRAGRRAAFRVAQIKVAKDYYWTDNDPLTVTLPGGTTVSGRIGTVVRSEAGRATLLDRKINTGNLRTFPAVVQQVMARHGCRTLAEAARYEREIVAAMTYRADFLNDLSLGQPLPPPVPITVPQPFTAPSFVPTPTIAPTPFPSPTPFALPTPTPYPWQNPPLNSANTPEKEVALP